MIISKLQLYSGQVLPPPAASALVTSSSNSTQHLDGRFDRSVGVQDRAHVLRADRPARSVDAVCPGRHVRFEDSARFERSVHHHCRPVRFERVARFGRPVLRKRLVQPVRYLRPACSDLGQVPMRTWL